jgi:hypothetical protein
MAVTVRLLGGFAVEVDGRHVGADANAARLEWLPPRHIDE